MHSVVPLSIMAKDANIPLYTISQLSALYAVSFLSVDSRFLPDSILIAKIDKKSKLAINCLTKLDIWEMPFSQKNLYSSN